MTKFVPYKSEPYERWSKHQEDKGGKGAHPAAGGRADRHAPLQLLQDRERPAGDLRGGPRQGGQVLRDDHRPGGELRRRRTPGGYRGGQNPHGAG